MPSEPIYYPEDLPHDEDREVVAAYQVISSALNGGRGVEGLRHALAREHSTLLGKLTNIIMEAVDNRQGDGRLSLLHMTVNDVATKTGWGENSRISELRQPFI